MERLPLISYILLCYNQENYIEKAVVSALNQNYPNLEIIISDDCSSDKTATIVEDCISKYRGEHTIRFNRNNKNLGLVCNLNVALSFAHGDFFVFAGGDDISILNRTTLSLTLLKEANTECLALNYKLIDSNGNYLTEQGFSTNGEIVFYRIEDYLNDSPCPPCSFRIISRKVFDFFGSLQDDCQTEDTTLNLRVLLLGGLAIHDAIGVEYRKHNNNISNNQYLYTKIDSGKIYNQYRIDIQTAYQKGVINSNIYKSLLKKINDYKATQKLIRQLYQYRKKYKRRWYKFRYLIDPHTAHNHRSLSYIRSITC